LDPLTEVRILEGQPALHRHWTGRRAEAILGWSAIL
jgi:hypothetical protein